MYILGPIMDHGKGELAASAYIKFGYPDMEAGNHPRMGGATGDEMQFGALFHHHQIVHVLGEAVRAQVEAGLHRLLDPASGSARIK